MRRLLAGEEVSHEGHVTVDRARLWTRPDEPPPLLAAAVSVETARWAAGWADGLITVNGERERMRQVADAYRDAGGRGPVVLQVHLSYAATDEEALRIAHEQWRTNVFDSTVCWDLELVEQFDSIAESVEPHQVCRSVLVSSDVAQHAAWLDELAGLGFDALYLHHVGQEQRAFIEAFGRDVLPQLDGATR
jgi:alkanesulfonate monooxygenase SsuD/methylene tetrahydromethanopterin reductase-like flavin-dependent oxidoreductase (luciferase family)